MDKRKQRRLVGRIITGSVLLGVATLIALGFVPKPVPVVVGKVEHRALEVTVDEPGKTRIRSKYVVSAPVTGQLSRINLEAGDQVADGAVVAEIFPVAPQLLDERTRSSAVARVSVAQANLLRVQASIGRADTSLRFANSQAERARKLRSEGGTSEQAFEQADFQARAAEEELASSRLAERVAQSELLAARSALASVSGKPGASNKVQVVAPTRGQVLRVLQKSEGVVQAGTPLLELGDPRELEVVVDVLTTDAVRIAVGAPARIERWGGDYPLAARVQRKQPSAFTTRSALGVEEQRAPVILDIIEDPTRWQQLGDGYRVETLIRVSKLESAVVVPAGALFREHGDWVTFAVKGGKAKKLTIEVGARTPDWAEVKRGLSAGEQVVLYPSDQVLDGVELSSQPSK